jgi:hypothetical protein
MVTNRASHRRGQGGRKVTQNMKLLALATLGLLAIAVPVMALNTDIAGDFGLDVGTDHGSAGANGGLSASDDARSAGLGLGVSTDHLVGDAMVDLSDNGGGLSAGASGEHADAAVDAGASKNGAVMSAGGSTSHGDAAVDLGLEN